MEKSNWKFKRLVNQMFYHIRSFKPLVKFLIWCIWFFRYSLRGFKPPKQDKIGGVIVNTQYKIVYVGNPKVASSTFKTYFSEHLQGSKFYLNISYEDFAKNYSEYSSYFKFTVVRDSWDRVLSCWQDKISNQKRFADVFILTRHRGLYPDMPFPDFVHWLNTENGSDKFADRHWISQHQILEYSSSPGFEIEIFELSNLAREFSLLAERLNLPKTELDNANKLGKSKQVIDQDSRLDISNRYSKDISLYSFK